MKSLAFPPFPPFRRACAAVLAVALLLSACGGGDTPEKMLVSARDYLAKNDLKAAIIQLKNVLNEKPDLPDARMLLGQALMRSGDAAGAEAAFRKALELKLAPELVVPALAQALLAQGQYKKLTDEFSSTELPQAAAMADLKTTLAQALAAQGKEDLAQQALKAALVADPSNSRALLFQAREKARQKDFDGGLVMVEAVLARSAGSEEAWKLKGDILAIDPKKSETALAAYRKAIEIKPAFVEGHGAIMSLFLREGKLEDAARQNAILKSAAPNTPQSMYVDSVIAYQKKEFKAAREAAQQLLKVVPNAPAVMQLAGAIELELNALNQAESMLSKSVQLAPEVVLSRRLLATVHLRMGQPAKALQALQPLLKADNLDAATNSLVGQAFLQNGDPNMAEAYFTKAAKLDPKDVKNRTSLALSHIARGRDDVGIAELQQIAAVEDGTTATMTLISAHLRRKEFDKALKTIDELEKKQPNQPLAASLRGRTLLEKRDNTGARKAFERSLEIDPAFFTSIASLVTMDVAEKKPEEARKRLEAALAKNPKNPPALLALAELRARAGGAKQEVVELITRAVTASPTEPAPRILLVDYHLGKKDFELALAAAQEGVNAVPDSPDMQEALARAFQASGDSNQAIAAFNKLSAMQPASPAAYLKLADLYMGVRKKDAALDSLRKALSLKPDLLEAQRYMIAILMAARDYDEATRFARSVQKQSPKNANGYMFEGDIAANQKKWDVAADAYRNGLKNVPSARLSSKLHAALLSAGKTAEADKFSGTWLKDNPKDIVYRMYLGDSASGRGDYVVAERQYGDVLRMQADHAVALNNLAWVRGKQNKSDAIALSEKALALAPNQAAFMDTLAFLYSQKDDYAKALEWQSKAIALAPQEQSYKLNLAKIHIKGGKKDLARQELEPLAKLGRGFVGHAEVGNLLKGL